MKRPVITAKLHELADLLIGGVATSPLPWAYGVVVGELGVGADRMTYFAKNAFSLAFADDVWSVRPQGKDHDLELFLSARKDSAAARALVGKLPARVCRAGRKRRQTQGHCLDQGSVSGAVFRRDQPGSLRAGHPRRRKRGRGGGPAGETAGRFAGRPRRGARAAPRPWPRRPPLWARRQPRPKPTRDRTRRPKRRKRGQMNADDPKSAPAPLQRPMRPPTRQRCKRWPSSGCNNAAVSCVTPPSWARPASAPAT